MRSISHAQGALKALASLLPDTAARIVGYVLRDNAALNLMQAIDAVMHKEMYFSPGVSGAVAGVSG